MLKFRIIHSIDELQVESACWDALWENSRGAMPTCQFALLQNFVREFHRNDAVRVFVIEDGGRFVAGIPFVIKNKLGLPMASLPSNEWMFCGDLLVEKGCDFSQVISLLVEGILQSGIAVFDCRWIETESLRWKIFFAALEHLAVPIKSPGFPVGIIELSEDWAKFTQRLSRNRRKKVSRSLKNLEKLGQVELVTYQPGDAACLPGLLETIFQIENKSWKGRNGTSIQAGGKTAFMKRAAQALAHREQLRIFLLTVNGEPIAFDLGFQSQRQYCSYKVSYDPNYAQYSPGQLLTYLTLEELHADHDCRRVDMVGELSQATETWTTETIHRGRLVWSGQQWYAKSALLTAFWLRQVRKIWRTIREPKAVG